MHGKEGLQLVRASSRYGHTFPLLGRDALRRRHSLGRFFGLISTLAVEIVSTAHGNRQQQHVQNIALEQERSLTLM
jgi:hypothetical protein